MSWDPDADAAPPHAPTEIDSDSDMEVSSGEEDVPRTLPADIPDLVIIIGPVVPPGIITGPGVPPAIITGPVAPPCPSYLGRFCRTISALGSHGGGYLEMFIS